MDIVIVWGTFLLLVGLILAFDLGAFSRHEHTISAREALLRTGLYFTLACLFTVFVYYAYERHWFGLGGHDVPVASGTTPHATPQRLRIALPFEADWQPKVSHGLPADGQEAATMFFTGYLVEQSLSMDNIFVIALIMGFFQVPPLYQHRVLFWGIIGALVMRGVMIVIGAALIHAFDWIIYVFGAILVWTSWKMLVSEDDHMNPEDSLLVKWVRRFIPVATHFEGRNFLTRIDGKLAVTPLALALLVVETTDVIFAVDSIPAVFGITHDPFLVFTSNVFAILGLRSLYFALADLLDRFRFLKYSLVVILAFVGLKMLSHAWVELTPLVSLLFIATCLGVGMGASWVFPEKEPPTSESAEIPATLPIPREGLGSAVANESTVRDAAAS
ncbi:MAG: membrane protein [Planctomycetaceae bacterium]|nr:MAG: membrane protein [Planctomycetaceae bacterium]